MAPYCLATYLRLSPHGLRLPAARNFVPRANVGCSQGVHPAYDDQLPSAQRPANFLVCASTLGRFRRCHANVTLQTRASKEELVHFAFEYWYWSSETRGSVDLCLADSARVRCRSRLSEGTKLTTDHLIDLRVKCHDCPSRLITQVPVKFLQVVAFRSTFRSPPSPFDYSSAGSVWRASDSREHRRPPA